MSNSVSPPTTANSRSPHVSSGSAIETGPDLEATLPENERPAFAPSQVGLKSWKELRRESRLTDFQMWMAPFPPPRGETASSFRFHQTWALAVRAGDVGHRPSWLANVSATSRC